MSIAGVVLAAGRSARMGNPKALLDFRGRPFVVAVLEALEALDLKHRVVALGPDADRIRPQIAGHQCMIVENPDPATEQIGSLRLALTALETVRPTGILVWPVDVPHVRLTTVERLLDAFERTGAPIVLPRFGERRGHPVLWSAALFEELQTSAAATREGARAVLHRHEKVVAQLAVDDPAVIDDIDTPEDYERLIREINRDAF
jgi:CTP:molybdopterin cytidylyltransferase MocA